MSTHSQIGIQNLDGSIETIYCHWYGSPFTNGATLVNHYKSETKIRKLISLGGLSSLHAKVNPPKGKEHSFDKRCNNVCVAYGRDRGHSEFMPLVRYKDIKSYDKAIRKNLDGEYFYLFNVSTKTWICYGIYENSYIDLTQYVKVKKK